MSKKEHEKLKKAIGLLETKDPEDYKQAMRILYRLAGVSTRFHDKGQAGILSLISGITKAVSGKDIRE
jgi:hypothetical protein